MRYLILILLLTACDHHEFNGDHGLKNGNERIAPTPSAKNTTTELTLKITFRKAWCNGSYPSEEMLDELNGHKPLKNTTVRLVHKQTWEETELNTDQYGLAKTILAHGDYNVYMTKRFDSNMGTGFNGDCKTWLNKPFASLKVTPEMKPTLTLEFLFECDPCDAMSKRRQ